MSYLVLARKYRPQDFDTVTGQEHVTRTLGNAIKRGKVAHAHLFCGPRGVGKTSIARILAKALNCAQGPTPSPCLECQNCKEITSGVSLAVREIDGASHNSVENVRDLIDSFRSLPAPGSRYKIYIIDEVHMLSVAAFNALLKSLEEPPPNTIFVLATTEVHKIPDTVISRCVRHDFRALSNAQIESRIKELAKQEKLTIEPEVVRMLARLADGSMRDAQSLLDRVQSFCEGTITAAEASKLLGTVERALLAPLAQAIVGRDPSKAIALIDESFTRGVDPGVFLKEFVSFWREILLAKFGGSKVLDDVGLSKDEAAELITLSSGLSNNDVQDLLHLAREGGDSALRSAYIKIALEALVVRMAARLPVLDIKSLLEKVEGGGGMIARSTMPSAPKISVPARDAQPQKAPVAPMQVTEKVRGELNWGEFVQHATSNGARILSEHLKRISVVEFSAGILQARGPRFTVSSLEHKDNLEKLKASLNTYSGIKDWKIKFDVSEGEPEAGSLHHELKKEESSKRKRTEENIVNHPKIKSLQRVFPGSSIEDIKVKE